MENLKLSRVDFRLIHGQVMTRWVANFNITDIVVIDDGAYKSAILKKILLGAAPSGVNVYVESVESSAQKWNDNTLPKGKMILLFKNTDTALRAWKAGVKYTSLQIGGIEGTGEKKNIYKNVVMSRPEAEQLKELHDVGVNVFMQPIPEDNPYPFKEVIAKFKMDV